VRHLLEWWQLRFVEFDKKAYAAMKSESPETHPHYWDAVSGICVFIVRTLALIIIIITPTFSNAP